MFVVTNHAVVRRQMKRGNVFLLLALLVFGTGFVVAWTWPQEELGSTYSIAALFGGILLWQMHQYYLRRYGPRFRQDAALAQALRGLGNRYTLLCFAGPRLPDYLLLGPHGISVLVARAVAGTVRCRNDRWSRQGAPALLSFFNDPLRQPAREAAQSLDRLGDHLGKMPEVGEVGSVPVEAIVVFTHPGVELDVEGSRYPALKARDVAGHVQRQKGNVPAPLIGRLRDWLIPPAEAAEPAKKPARTASRPASPRR